MSETWVIKDNAPVDDASLTLAMTNISFTTNNQKATSIGITQDGLSVMLLYGGIDAVAQLIWVQVRLLSGTMKPIKRLSLTLLRLAIYLLGFKLTRQNNKTIQPTLCAV